MKDALIVSMLSVLPRKRTSRLGGLFARSRLSRWITRWFVRTWKINLLEAENADLDAYQSLNDLFTRRLKPGIRPIDRTPGALTSPCDAVVGWVGRTHRGALTLHGQPQPIAPLIGESLSDEVDAIVLYLSPQDYHRVHVPLDTMLEQATYMPGDFWPVRPSLLARRPAVLPRNERLTVSMQTAATRHHLVMVGAFGVGRIELHHGPEPFPEDAETHELQCAVAAGDELGTFHLGSTVVIVSPAGTWSWDISEGDRVRVGERLARPSPDASA